VPKEIAKAMYRELTSFMIFIIEDKSKCRTSKSKIRSDRWNSDSDIRHFIF